MCLTLYVRLKKNTKDTWGVWDAFSEGASGGGHLFTNFNTRFGRNFFAPRGNCRTFAVAIEMQRRVWEAAQQRPSKLASTFTLHYTCSVNLDDKLGDQRPRTRSKQTGRFYCSAEQIFLLSGGGKMKIEILKKWKIKWAGSSEGKKWQVISEKLNS